MKLETFTLIVPYYRNCAMLRRQIEEWERYPEAVKIICVDDGSPEPALPIIEEHASAALLKRVSLYRITVDIPWNREEARNIGAKMAGTDWILQVDIDHILPADAASALLATDVHHKHWYRFSRFRRGAADDTRKKDALPPTADYGQIHPHVDSYLVRKKVYWKTGGYDEDYAGVLGGGGEFLRRLSEIAPLENFAPPIRLEVYTRGVIADASDWSLSRDSSNYGKRRRAKEAVADTEPKQPFRYPYERQELSKYPDVAGEFDTVDALLNGKSIARFGDGELKIIDGAGYSREPANAALGAELAQILRSPAPGCLVGVPTLDPRGPKYSNWRRHRARFAEHLAADQVYHSAFISRPDSAPWIYAFEYAAAIAGLWRDRHAAVLCEPDNSILKVVRLSAAKVTHIACPHQLAYAQIDQLKAKILAAGACVAILSCGPTATCLANRLDAAGLQAIDIGSAGGFLLKLLAGKHPAWQPQSEHFNAAEVA